MPNITKLSYFPQRFTPIPPKLREEQRYWSLHPQLVLSEESAHELTRSYALMEEFLRSDTPQRLGLSIRLGRMESMRGHGVRVAIFSLLINQELQRSQNRTIADTRILATAALFHDIGKLKPDIHRVVMSSHKIPKTDTQAWETIKLHPGVGSNAIQDMLDLIDDPERELVADAIYNHHEKADGTGYHDVPLVEIPNEARIICLADSMDVMMCKRPYQLPRPTHEVFGEVERCSGRHFDPNVASAAISIRPPQGEEFISYKSF